MTTPAAPTRRSFIQTAGTALSAPLAAAVVSVPASAAAGDDPLKARLAHFEDVEAIRALNQQCARLVNAGACEELAALFANPSDVRRAPDVRGVSPDGFGEHDAIEIAPDGLTATALLHCTVEMESAIGPDCPLVDMARQQGGGVVRRTERGAFENVYVKRDGAWKIQRFIYRPI